MVMCRGLAALVLSVIVLAGCGQSEPELVLERVVEGVVCIPLIYSPWPVVF